MTQTHASSADRNENTEPTLHARMLRLEERYRRLRLVAIALALSGVALLTVAARTKDTPLSVGEVRTQRIVLVDESGAELGFFGIDSADPDLRLSLGTAEGSRFQVLVKGAGNRSRAELALDDMRKNTKFRMYNGKLMVFDPTTKKAATLSVEVGATVETITQ